MKKGFINALFVEKDGVYSNLKNIELFDVSRDARTCSNGAPAIAHPPCERWGRYWPGGPSVKKKKKLGDDGACFAFALWYVRTYGGVIEHPEASHAFNYFGIARPPKAGGWIKADDYGGYVCCVEQGHYGHKARKATWLYACKTDLPELKWGGCKGKMKMDEGFHSKKQAREMRARSDYRPLERLSRYERLATPIPFRDLLIKIAKSANHHREI